MLFAGDSERPRGALPPGPGHLTSALPPAGPVSSLPGPSVPPPATPPNLKDAFKSIVVGRTVAGDRGRIDLMWLLTDAAVDRFIEKLGDVGPNGSRVEQLALALFARAQVHEELIKCLQCEIHQLGYEVRELEREKRGLTETQLQQSRDEVELRAEQQEHVATLRRELEVSGGVVSELRCENGIHLEMIQRLQGEQLSINRQLDAANRKLEKLKKRGSAKPKPKRGRRAERGK